MHGRLKVRTSAEEAIRKKKEQDLKAKAYRNGTDKIKSLRHKEQAEEPLLELTWKILSVNPDVATLWNIRRECILSLMQRDNVDNSIFDRDLSFTELCLQVQPKSYCAWHHRVWILENSPQPDWEREVKLCNLYLKKDERNFHCWDYRRYVVAKANIPADKEFEFCDEKIMKNFSNYSSWHYRSKLLPQLHPHETDPTRPISEAKLKEELELVITAAFTDPNDSSSWFYQRWLLGFAELQLDLAAVKITSCRAIVAFTKPIELTKNEFALQVDDDKFNFSEWKSLSGGKSDSVWLREGSYAIESEACVTLSCKNDTKTYKLSTKRVGEALIGIKLPIFGYEFTAAVKEVLRNQLDSCNQLLEYEPDSKWTLLTAALLMRSLDRFQYHSETLNHLKRLQHVDELRAGYYGDLASKWTVECALRNWVEREEAYANGSVDLSNLDLTTLYYGQFFVIARSVDVRGNPKLNRRSCIFQQIDGCEVEY